jgi:hypothetical protein
MRRRVRPARSDNKKGIEATIVVALIGAISAIVIALINSQTIMSWLLRPTSTPSMVPTPVASTISQTFPSETPIRVIDLPLITNTPQPTVTPSPTLPPVTETPTLVLGMHVRLYADKTSGKAPLRVKLDARDSFLQAPGGQIYGCKSGACNYSWEVYSGGQKIGRTERNSSGTFQYTFGQKGLYFITVVVCRGQENTDCNGSGAQFEVR